MVIELPKGVFMFARPRGLFIVALLAGLILAGLPAAADGGRGPAIYDGGSYPSIWRGLYGGVHAGFGWSGDADGAVGGAQAGYNWQSQQYVYGLEADISLSDIGVGGSVTACDPDPNFGCATARAGASIDWLATMRGRFGVLVQPSLLLYATAGLAIVHAFGTGKSWRRCETARRHAAGQSCRVAPSWQTNNPRA